MQTKKQSFFEACTNTAVGFLFSLASTFVIFPIMGFESTVSKNILITLFFTLISILRGYFIRRVFNKKVKRFITYPNGENFKIDCFECEIEMPVIQDKQRNLYCSNCGLKH